MSRLATLLLALQLTLPHLDAPNCVGAAPRQGGRRLVQQPSYASEATVAVSTGAELVAALANGAVSTATIDVHIRVDDDDFTGYTLPIIINNNKTVEGSREVKPILDLNFLRSKVRLANGVHLRFSELFLDRFSTSGVVTRAPGFDLIADTPPGPPAYVETVGVAFMQVACYPQPYFSDAVKTIPRPKEVSGEQVVEYDAPQDGCTNATEAAARGIDVSGLSPAKLCWPAKVLLVDTTVASAVINTTTNATVPTNYIIRQFNTEALCKNLMSASCVEKLGPLGCFVSLFVNPEAHQPTTSPQPGGESPSPRGISGGTGQGLSGGGGNTSGQGLRGDGGPGPEGSGGGSEVPIGAVVGGVVGGTAGLVLLVSLVVLLAARRRGRTAGGKAGPPGSTLRKLAGGGGAAAGASAEVVLDVPSILPSDGSENGAAARRMASAVTAPGGTGLFDGSSSTEAPTCMISFDTSGDGPSGNGKDRSKGGGAGANFQHKYGLGSHGATGDTNASCSTQQLSTVVTPLTQCRTDLDAQLCGVEDSCDEHGLPVRRIANYSEGRTASSTVASSTTERGGSGARDGGGGSGSTKKVHLLPGPLGSGAYGSVHKGTWQGRTVAVKVVADMHMVGPPDERLLDSFTHEVEVLGRCCHPNIVRLLAACLTPPRLCLVMELMDTSLEAQLYGKGPRQQQQQQQQQGEQEQDSGPMPLDKVLYIGLEIARGLEYLHPTIVHRDLKPANVLLGEPHSPRPVVKLADFGLSRLRCTVVATQSPEAGTPAYLAPECYNPANEIVTHKADVYALGVLLWEMLAGRRPWAGYSQVAIGVATFLHNKRLPLDEPTMNGRCPPRLRQLLQQCWESDPQRRPAAAEVAKTLMLAQQELEAGGQPGSLARWPSGSGVLSAVASALGSAVRASKAPAAADAAAGPGEQGQRMGVVGAGGPAAGGTPPGQPAAAGAPCGDCSGGGTAPVAGDAAAGAGERGQGLGDATAAGGGSPPGQVASGAGTSGDTEAGSPAGREPPGQADVAGGSAAADGDGRAVSPSAAQTAAAGVAPVGCVLSVHHEEQGLDRGWQQGQEGPLPWLREPPPAMQLCGEEYRRSSTAGQGQGLDAVLARLDRDLRGHDAQPHHQERQQGAHPGGQLGASVPLHHEA